MPTITLNELNKTRSRDAQESLNYAADKQLVHVIGEIVENRIRCGLSQRDVSTRTGISQSTIARIETFQIVPKLDTICKIAECLSVDMDVNPRVKAVYTQYEYDAPTAKSINFVGEWVICGEV